MAEPNWIENHARELGEQCDQAAAEGAARGSALGPYVPRGANGADIPATAAYSAAGSVNAPTQWVHCAVCGKPQPLPPIPQGTMAGMVICAACAQELGEMEILLLQAGFQQGIKIGVEIQYRHTRAIVQMAQAEACWLRKSEAQVVEIARSECKSLAGQLRYWKKAWIKTIIIALAGWLAWLVALAQ